MIESLIDSIEIVYDGIVQEDDDWYVRLGYFSREKAEQVKARIISNEELYNSDLGKKTCELIMNQRTNTDIENAEIVKLLDKIIEEREVFDNYFIDVLKEIRGNKK